MFTKLYDRLQNYGFLETIKIALRKLDHKLHPEKYFHTKIFETPRDKLKSVLFITGEGKNANTYYRCEIPKSQLETIGWHADIIHYDYLDLGFIKNYQYIVYYRLPFSRKINETFKLGQQYNAKQICSHDDLVYRKDLIEKYSLSDYIELKEKAAFLEQADSMQNFMRMFNYGLASTNYLAEDMKKFIKKDVFVLRNAYKDVPPLSKKAVSEKIILGYFSGSESHDRDFAIIWPAVKDILEEHINVELWIGGWIKFDFDNFTQRIRKFPFMNRDEFYKVLSKIDINLLPLEDTEFNRAKSEIKFIEAALFEIPTVASRVGDVKDAIKEGSGISVENSEDRWKDSIENLINNKKSRENLGYEARQYILNNYKKTLLGRDFVNFLKD